MNDTMYMPEIADSIEVSVIEGRSTPYYVYLDDTLKLPSLKVVKDSTTPKPQK